LRHPGPRPWSHHGKLLALLALLCVNCAISGCPGTISMEWRRAVRTWPFDEEMPPAVTAAQRQVREQPTSPDAHVLLGEQYAGLGLPGLAMAEFQAALNYDSWHGPAILGSAAVTAECGDMRRALALSRRAVLAMPNEPGAFLNLGQIRLRRRECIQAREAFDQARDLDPGNEDAWLGLITSYLEGGDPARAATECKTALSEIGATPRLLTNYGAVLEALDEHEQAAEQYRAALRAAPDMARTMNNLAYMYATLGQNLDEALPLAREAVRLRPRNASLLDTLGYVLHRRGDHREAASVLMQARALRPRSGAVRYHLGLALEALGDKQKATTEFRETLRLDPNTPAADAAARRLKTRSAAGSRR